MICSAAAMLAVSSNVFAQTTTTTMTTSTSAKKPVFFEQGLPLVDSTDGKYKADPVPYTGYYAPGYAAPAGAKVDNTMDVNVNASFIYWYFSQDAMDVAYVAPDATSGVSGSVVNQKFKYKPGFKIGLGYDTHFDNWAVNADYTWLHASAKTNVSATDLSANNLFPQASSNQVKGDHVHSQWKMHMDMVDLVAGRPFYKSTNVIVSPTGGLRALFLRQTNHVTLSESTINQAVSKNSSHSWAIGPKVGVNTKMIIWNGFRIDSVLGASVLYTRYTKLVNEELDAVATPVTSIKTDINAIRPTLDMGLGLGFASYAMDNKLFFDASIRYDFAQYWSQNMSRNFASQLQGSNDAIGDLAMHGVTVNLRCDF
jgi:hypothetical protein